MIRKRAVHKETLKVHGVEFVRYIIYIMHLDEYNRVHQALKLKKAYTLDDSFMIILVIILIQKKRWTYLLCPLSMGMQNMVMLKISGHQHIPLNSR